MNEQRLKHSNTQTLSQGSEATARLGDVDDSANQVQLLGFLPCSWFYTGGWRLYRGPSSHVITGYSRRDSGHNGFILLTAHMGLERINPG